MSWSLQQARWWSHSDDLVVICPGCLDMEEDVTMDGSSDELYHVVAKMPSEWWVVEVAVVVLVPGFSCCQQHGHHFVQKVHCFECFFHRYYELHQTLDLVDSDDALGLTLGEHCLAGAADHNHYHPEDKSLQGLAGAAIADLIHHEYFCAALRI